MVDLMFRLHGDDNGKLNDTVRPRWSPSLPSGRTGPDNSDRSNAESCIQS